MRYVQEMAVLANGQIITRNVDHRRLAGRGGLSNVGLGLFAWIKCCMTDYLRGIVHRKRVSRAIRVLDQLDDHVLQDIGVSRLDIPVVAEQTLIGDTKLATSRNWR